MEEMFFKFDKRHRNTILFSCAVYVVCIVFLTLETVLSGIALYGTEPLSAFWNKLLFNRENNSPFMFYIFFCLNAYCIMGLAKNLLILRRVSRACLKITRDTASGFAFGKARSWADGAAFTIDSSAVASVGRTETKLVGNSMVGTLVINTADKSYFIPGIDNEQGAINILQKQ